MVAAGSLLEFVLSDPTFSMPVGRIEYHHLGPMTFEEYLCAAGQPRFREFVRSFSLGDEVPPPVHDVFKTLFLDVGLMTGACGLSLLDFAKVGDLILINQGACPGGTNN